MKAQMPTPRNGEPAAPKETIAYAEILKMAHDEGLKSIATQLLLQPSEENGRLCIVKATVETERGRYEGLGDADPGNVEDFLVPHLIRVAETRAKARALRDAVNCGVVSYEELDDVDPARVQRPGPGAQSSPIPASRPSVPSPRPRTNTPARHSKLVNGVEPMSEAQRRYLFRLMASQGYQREAAEERLKDLFKVPALAHVSKLAATQMIDRLLATAPGNGSDGHGAPAHPQH
jgi:hypothetical protein